MIKKLLCTAFAVLMIMSVSFTSFADEGIEYYDEYDDYYEFEQDYYDTVVFPEKEDKVQWYNKLSPIPPVIGLVAGTLTLLVLYRRQDVARRQSPERKAYNYAPNIKHTIKSDTDENTL